MKRFIAAAGLAALLATGANAGSTATSSSGADATANATIYQGGQVVYLDQSNKGGKTEVVNSGKYTVRSAPAVQAPSMGSGHPCGLSGSIGISIIGGGASGGTSKVDEACLLAQMGQGEAALIMIARRDKEACFALRAVGRIPAASTCYKGEKVVQPRPAPRPSIPNCPTGSKWDGKGCWMPKKR